MCHVARNTRILAIAALAVASAGCGSPMKTVRPSGLTTGSMYSVSGVDLPGTPIEIVAIHDISSRGVGKNPVTTTESGLFAVAKHIVRSDGTVLIAKGTRVTAGVTRKEHTRVARPGWLEIGFISTQSATGAPVRLDERPVRFEGESRKPGMIAGAVLLFPTGLLFLLLSGSDVTLKAGSTFAVHGSILELPAASK